MKVLWFSNTPASGEEFIKTEVIRGGWLKSLDKALKNMVDLHVAFYYPKYIDPFEYNGVHYYPICKKNWKLELLNKLIFGNYKDREDLQIYLSIIKAVNPDLIHIHGSENPFGCIMEETSIPVVLSIQGNYTVYNQKYFSGIESKYASVKGAKLLSPFSWVFNKSYNYQFKNSSVRNTIREKRVFRVCRNIIGRTDWDRRITRILAPQSIYFHNDEVLREAFFKAEWKNPDNKKIVIHSTIGAAIFKGFETVCQSLNELNKIGVDIEWRVAGVSSNCLLNKVVKNKLRESYPSKGLILLGDLNEKQLIEKMLEADIYLMPSHIENSPNSLCEAMLIGMPCITTLAGGSSSLLTDKEEGLVIQDGDPWSMAGAILELVNNLEKSIKYGQKARERALIRHDSSKIVNDLVEIYNNITAKQR